LNKPQQISKTTKRWRANFVGAKFGDGENEGGQKFFVYKGKKWAMIVIMIYWIFYESFQLVSGECGNKLDRNSNFCPKCGTKI